MPMFASSPSVSPSILPSRTSARLDFDSTIVRVLNGTGWMYPLTPAGSSPALLNTPATYSAARLCAGLPVLRPSMPSLASASTWDHQRCSSAQTPTVTATTITATIADGKTVRFGAHKESASAPEWSPDGQQIAYRGRVADKAGLIVSKPDGSGARFLAEMSGTNAPLPGEGKTIAWAPDGKRIAFVSSTPGPETADAGRDPIVITRYLYKPDAAEGTTHLDA